MLVGAVVAEDDVQHGDGGPLREAGQVLDQQMPAGEHAGEGEAHGFVLAQQHVGQRGALALAVVAAEHDRRLRAADGVRHPRSAHRRAARYAMARDVPHTPRASVPARCRARSAEYSVLL